MVLVVLRISTTTLSGSSTGFNATEELQSTTSGEISDVEIMSHGTGYVVGDTLTISGTLTTTGFTAGTVTVNSVTDNINDSISIAGVSSVGYKGYNNLYRITGISSVNQIEVESISPVDGVSVSGVGSVFTSDCISLQ